MSHSVPAVDGGHHDTELVLPSNKLSTKLVLSSTECHHNKHYYNDLPFSTPAVDGGQHTKLVLPSLPSAHHSCYHDNNIVIPTPSECTSDRQGLTIS